jgi:hypothetical protein
MLNHALIIALSVFGYYACFWEKAIFGKVAAWLKKRLPEYLRKPLFECPICMVPWYGVPAYLFIWGWNKELILVIFAAMGINAIVVVIENKLQDIADELSGRDI